MRGEGEAGGGTAYYGSIKNQAVLLLGRSLLASNDYVALVQARYTALWNILFQVSPVKSSASLPPCYIH